MYTSFRIKNPCPNCGGQKWSEPDARFLLPAIIDNNVMANQGKGVYVSTCIKCGHIELYEPEEVRASIEKDFNENAQIPEEFKHVK